MEREFPSASGEADCLGAWSGPLIHVDRLDGVIVPSSSGEAMVCYSPLPAGKRKMRNGQAPCLGWGSMSGACLSCPCVVGLPSVLGVGVWRVFVSCCGIGVPYATGKWIFSKVMLCVWHNGATSGHVCWFSCRLCWGGRTGKGSVLPGFMRGDGQWINPQSGTGGFGCPRPGTLSLSHPHFPRAAVPRSRNRSRLWSRTRLLWFLRLCPRARPRVFRGARCPWHGVRMPTTS